MPPGCPVAVLPCPQSKAKMIEATTKKAAMTNRKLAEMAPFSVSSSITSGCVMRMWWSLA